MYRPPLDPPDHPVIDRPTGRSILVSYATIPAFVLLLWVVSHPLAGAVVLTAILGLLIGAQRAWRVVRCFYDCGGFAFDLGGSVRITITRTCTDDVS